MTNKRLKELTELIIEWGNDKGIPQKSTYKHQLNKTLEEITELDKAILDNNAVEIKDAIGDIYVTLVMAGEFDEAVKYCITRHYEKISLLRTASQEPSKTLIALFAEYNLFRFNHETDKLFLILNHLENLSMAHRFFLENAVESAYNVINKRKGKMINGQFVKDE